MALTLSLDEVPVAAEGTITRCGTLPPTPMEPILPVLEQTGLQGSGQLREIIPSAYWQVVLGFTLWLFSH